MPIFESVAEVPFRPGTPSVAVRPSLAVELFWTSWMLWRDKAPSVPGLDLKTPAAQALAARIADLWTDGEPCLTELLVLAGESGTLFTLDPATLLDGISAAAAQPVDAGRLKLATESREGRDRILKRLERLSSDPALRRRLEWVLRDLWSLIRPAWEAGRPRVEAAARRLADQVAEGTDPIELLTGLHSSWREQVGTGLRGEDAVIVPALISGSALMLDLPGAFLAGTPLDPPDPAAQLRTAAGAAARPLKALADPTRLAVLGFLRGHPAGVVEIAERFGLSQPTVSVHFKTLREAGLVRGERQTGRVLYSVDEARVQAVLAAAGRVAEGNCD